MMTYGYLAVACSLLVASSADYCSVISREIFFMQRTSLRLTALLHIAAHLL